ncbi:MAG: HTTM domain-containing protein [Spartobacteria bacterium]
MLRSIDRFLFGPDDTQWDFIRIGAALTVLLSILLAGWSGNYERLYGHEGILPRTRAIDAVYWPAFLFLMKSDPAWIWQIYWATCIAALFLAIGLWTRITAAVTFFLYVATIQRNLLSFNGECGILGFTLVALAFAPAPQRWSVDHLLRKKPLPATTEIWPARFMQINVCMVYLFTTIGKLVGAWDIGSGDIWYQITLCDWFRFPDAEWLRTPLVCFLVVHGSLLLEGSFAFLIWTRLRLPLLLLLTGLHVVITILFCNALFFFNLAAVAALCSFLRSRDIKRLQALFRKRRHAAASAIEPDPTAADKRPA